MTEVDEDQQQALLNSKEGKEVFVKVESGDLLDIAQGVAGDDEAVDAGHESD